MAQAKKNESQDIKTASREDLLKMLAEQRAKLQALKFDLAAGKIKNVNEIRHAKKNIARVSTQLTVEHAEREISHSEKFPRS